MAFFKIMCKIGNEISAACGDALQLPVSNARVLDLCMAPGGYTASTLEHSPHAIVCALTLPSKLGGHPVIHRKDKRVSIIFKDITTLYKEFGLTELPQDHPKFSKFSDMRLWYGKSFDLVFCDGQVLRTQEPHIVDYRREAIRLTASQLILALQRITRGGTLIMLLHNISAYETIKLLSVFDKIADIQIFKPVSGHKKKGTFYLIAKDVQPEHGDAVAAVNEWKKIWSELTFHVPGHDGHRDPLQVADESELAKEVLELLEKFSERVIELGEPIWRIQMDALANTPWTNKLGRNLRGKGPK